MLPMGKMADKTLPGYQPMKFADIDYVKELSFQHRKGDI